MKDHLAKIIIVSLLAVIVGLPVVLRTADDKDAPVFDEKTQRLVIYTPHNEQIRYELEHAFNHWRAQQKLPAVEFDWRSPGGTSDIRKGILSQYQAIIDRSPGSNKTLGENLDQGIGADLFFGGGDYDHSKTAQGIEDQSDSTRRFRIVDDPQIPPELFTAAFPESHIGGEPLYRRYTFARLDEHGERVEYNILGWTGVTLSSFGIVYNQDTLDHDLKGEIDRPQTWADLTDPRLQGWVALADPSHSGSITQTFNTILRREGWNEGWATLRRVYANARYFASSSDRVPADVSHGEAAMGMCIDFYGRYQSGSVGGGRMSYVDPIEHGKSMTATTADPITLLRGAPHKALAQEFIAWLLSEEAQSLWQRGVGDGSDALVRPDKFELRRQPIRADMYTDDQRASWVDGQLNPFASAVPYPENTPNYFGMVATITQAMAIDSHDDLVAAWRALDHARRVGHPNLAQMQRLFDAMPDELVLAWPDEDLADHWRQAHYDPAHPRHGEVCQTLADFAEQMPKGKNELEANRLVWRSFFQQNYRKIVELGR